MKQMSVAEVMRLDHKRLEALLLNVMGLISKKSPEAAERFLDLKINVEKHFFVEESAIFSSYSSEFDISGRDINLIEEHKQMRIMLADAKKLIDKKKLPDLTEFEKILLTHQEIEDDYFYQGLENGLNKKKKAEIVKEILKFIKI